MRKFLQILTVAGMFGTVHAQVLIDPNGGGGFESGSSFSANGWTLTNGSAENYWTLGTAATGYSGARCAYITDNGTAYNYNTEPSSSVKVHFYQSVDRTGYTNLYLDFDWKGVGEAGWDALSVGFTGSEPSAGGSIYSPRTILLNEAGGQSTWTHESYNVSTVNTGHIYLTFYWFCGTTQGTNPPHAVDNIALYVLLPVDIVNLSAQKDDEDNVILNWEVSDAENVSHFYVERSIDGIRYTRVGEIKFEDAINYSFVDSNPIPDKYFYRLKAVDNDGTQKVSNNVSIELDVKHSEILKLAPNPANFKTRVSMVSEKEYDADVIVMDILGVVVKTVPTHFRKGLNEIIVDVQDMKPGVYFISTPLSKEPKMLIVK